MEMSWGRLFPEQRRQILPGEAALFLHHLLRRARGDDFAALDPAFGAEVDDPVGGLDDVQVMLDHTTLLPCSTRAWSTSSSLRTSSKCSPVVGRSEEHTSELQSLMRISYAVFCLKKKRTHTITLSTNTV